MRDPEPTRTLEELAAAVRVHAPCAVVGDPQIRVSRVAHPRDGDLSGAIVPLLEASWRADPPAAAAGLVPAGAEAPLAGLLVADRPRLALGVILQALSGDRWVPGLDPTAHIDPTATLGRDVHVGPFVVVGAHATIGDRVALHAHSSVGVGASLGDDSVLHAGARVGDRCELGRRVTLHPNAVVGADGFSYATARPSNVDQARATRTLDGTATPQPWVKIPSIGIVVLEDDVEIGAGSCIDRATLQATRVGRGTKIDNLVQVAHNVQVGEHCLLVSQVGIAGSSVLGDGVVISGQAGVSDHQTVGSMSVVLAQSAVTRALPDHSIVFGNPARHPRRWFGQYAEARRIKPLRKRVRELEARLAALERAESEP